MPSTRGVALALTGALALAFVAPGAAAAQAAPPPAARPDLSALNTSQKIVAAVYLMGYCQAFVPKDQAGRLAAQGDKIPAQTPEGTATTLGAIMRDARDAGAKQAEAKPPTPDQCKAIAARTAALLKPAG